MGLSIDRLKTILNYDPGSGDFTWISRTSNRIKIGDAAGHIGVNGYLIIGIGGVNYLAHRLAFLYMDGNMPRCVDHINGDRADNRWSNLRDANHEQNNANRGLTGKNTSGVKGVHWSATYRKWVATVWSGGKMHYAGSYKDLTDAELAVRRKREEIHGEFANHG